jgi:DNA-binding NarL/FixJ family response regulator
VISSASAGMYTPWPELTGTRESKTTMPTVRLAAAGLSNPAIGSRLFMSRSTVKTHLSHIYAKLGITNRTELATLTHAHLTRR